MRIAIDRTIKHSYNYSYENRDSFMAYRIHHLNKKTGVTYVYESVSRWDKEKKQARSTQVCIGKLDKETGAFIPSKHITQSTTQHKELYWTTASPFLEKNATISFSIASDEIGSKSAAAPTRTRLALRTLPACFASASASMSLARGILRISSRTLPISG